MRMGNCRFLHTVSLGDADSSNEVRVRSLPLCASSPTTGLARSQRQAGCAQGFTRQSDLVGVPLRHCRSRGVSHLPGCSEPSGFETASK